MIAALNWGGMANCGIAQHYIYPFRTDGIHRSRLDVPTTLKFNHILPLINQLMRSYDVRILQGDMHLYDLDLSGCFSHLTSLQGSLPNETPLRDIMEKTLSKRSDWQICVKNPDLLADVTSSLHNLTYCGIMPSRVTVRLVSKKDGFLKRLDPEKHADRRILLAVAQLSRIVGRGLEHAAFQRLQAHLQLKAVTLTVEFLSLLGHLVLSLRWRIAWWKTLGIDQTAADKTQLPDEQDEVTKRLRGICETLFVYFCSLSRQQRDWNEKEFRGRTYRYPDTELEVFEEFPRGESRADIEAWMKSGEDKIREARVEERLRFIGLL
jgi:hypothetical protein